MREALRYRIRKKRSLAQLALSLSDLYSEVQLTTSSTLNSQDSQRGRSGSSVDSANQGGNDMMQDGLLPTITNMDRVERRARIRELLDEVGFLAVTKTTVLSLIYPPHQPIFVLSLIMLLCSFMCRTCHLGLLNIVTS